ncbi:MAG TPA: hypothetical protein V6D22_00310 [Candidatus Obscuribacterales bacterium]
MFETLGELVFGPVGLVAAAVVALSSTESGKRILRTGTKTAVKAGYYLGEKGKEVAEQMQDGFGEIVDEAHAEAKHTGKKSKSKSKSASEANA